MWKKLDDAMGVQPESDSKLESLGDALIESLMEGRLEKRDSAVGPQKVLAEGHQPSSSSPTMTTYTEALNEFTKNATAFIEQLPLLSKARDSYEQAMRAGAELRKILDTGQQNLQTLMAQLEQAVNVHGVKAAALDRKKPEPTKVEAIRGTEESSGGVRRFP
jgi:exonuclease VII small subunit